jgi:chitin disaccharide deacetylase
MRSAVCLVVVLVGTSLLRAQAADTTIRLIVQADDMGAAHGINAATIDAYQHGIVRSTNVIMPSPWVPEAAALLNQNPGLEVGVHLALTSEWTSIKWRPLTQAPSLVH